MRAAALPWFAVAFGLACGPTAPPPPATSLPSATSAPSLPTVHAIGALVPLAPPTGDLASSYRESIRTTIRAGMSALRTCYERELAKDPTLEGRVVVRFVLEPSGDVREVTTPENLAAPAVGACAADVVRAMKFPPREHGAIVVSYPLEFKPSN